MDSIFNQDWTSVFFNNFRIDKTPRKKKIALNDPEIDLAIEDLIAKIEKVDYQDVDPKLDELNPINPKKPKPTNDEKKKLVNAKKPKLAKSFKIPIMNS